MPAESLSFKFIGGHPCLDFVNTLRHRLGPQPQDLLRAYADLLSWGRQAGILPAREAAALLRQASARPRAAQGVVERAVRLREALHRIFSAAARGRLPALTDLGALNRALTEAGAAARIVRQGARFTWEWGAGPDRLDRPLWPVVRAAATLLTSDELHAVRECAGPDCAWLFMDQSKNRSRRWCDMKVCGNRAKARRHYQRNR